MRVLGVETSCDETGVAIYDSDHGLLAHVLYSQVRTHAEYGGVVPELASRDHIRKLIPLIEMCLKKAEVTPKQLNGIAYTAGPGLVGALMVGASLARSLAWSWKIPSIAVHHMEGHLLAPMLEPNPPLFPFIALLVSGGHTQLVAVEGVGQYQILGESLDDAAGEAFDKTAKMLGLGYPGGPALAALAESGNYRRFDFPRPMMDRPGLDFSFSGLKTHALTTLAQASGTPEDKADIAAAFQSSVVDTLIGKSRRALKQKNMSRLVVAGGVSANRLMRQRLNELKERESISVYFPRLEFCTDNGAMIAFAGCQRLLAGEWNDLEAEVKPRWPLDSLSATNPRYPSERA